MCHELQASIHFFELSISTNDFHNLLNAFPQILHLCGFSFVWMILCRQRVEACLKPLWHTLQTKGRAPRNTVIHIIQRWKHWKVLYLFCYFSDTINLFFLFNRFFNIVVLKEYGENWVENLVQIYLFCSQCSFDAHCSILFNLFSSSIYYMKDWKKGKIV